MNRSLSLASCVYFDTESHIAQAGLEFTMESGKTEFLILHLPPKRWAYITIQDFIEPWESKPVLPTDNTMYFPTNTSAAYFVYLYLFFLSSETLYYFLSDRGAIPL